MCCCASRRVFIASPCRHCASPNLSANACFCEDHLQKSTNRHPATPASLNSNTPPTNWNFVMLDFPRTALREGGDDTEIVSRHPIRQPFFRLAMQRATIDLVG